MESSTLSSPPHAPPQGFHRVAVPMRGVERLRARARAFSSAGVTSAWSPVVNSLLAEQPVIMSLHVARCDGHDELLRVVVGLSPTMNPTLSRFVTSDSMNSLILRAPPCEEEGDTIAVKLAEPSLAGDGSKEGSEGLRELQAPSTATSSVVGSALRTLGSAVRGSVVQLAGSATEKTIDSALALGSVALTGGRRDVLLEHYQRVPKPAPPPFAYGTECISCVASGAENGTFGILRHKHHCRHCGGSFCADHVRWRYRMPKFEGGDTPQRVCWDCVLQLRREEFENRNAERLCRISDFFSAQLQPFVTLIDDTVAAKARRVGR